MTWTVEKIKQLKKLWQKGKSTVEIGRELGISKNAVVGKVHRLELESRPSPIKKSIVTPVSEKKIINPKEENKLITLIDLKMNSCRWPVGDPKENDFHFCGADTITGKPYCSEHCKIAYTSLRELTLQNAKAKKEKAAYESDTEDDEEENTQKVKEKNDKSASKKMLGEKKKVSK